MDESFCMKAFSWKFLNGSFCMKALKKLFQTIFQVNRIYRRDEWNASPRCRNATKLDLPTHRLMLSETLQSCTNIVSLRTMLIVYCTKTTFKWFAREIAIETWKVFSRTTSNSVNREILTMTFGSTFWLVEQAVLCLKEEGLICKDSR